MFSDEIFSSDDFYFKVWNSEYSAFENAALYNPNGDSAPHYSQKPPTQPPVPSSSTSTASQVIKQQNKKFVRAAADEIWEDPTLNEWPENDFRLFVGDLGNEVTTEMLTREFQGYKTFVKAKVCVII